MKTEFNFDRLLPNLHISALHLDIFALTVENADNTVQCKKDWILAVILYGFRSKTPLKNCTSLRKKSANILD